MNEQELMLTSILNCKRTDLYNKNIVLTPEQEKRLQKMEERRNNDEPVQYIIGSTNFMGIDLKVDKRVLIPRPETEIMVDFIIDKCKGYQSDQPIKILELGTGSGNVAVALAQNVKNSQIISIDLSQDALDLALENALASGVENQIQFVCENMIHYFIEYAEDETKFDIIVSNPPYIKTEDLKDLPADVQHEPQLALNGGSDGLYFLRQIIMQSSYLLKTEGWLIFEIGDHQNKELDPIFRDFSHFTKVDYIKDYTRIDRIACAQMPSSLNANVNTLETFV